MKTILRTSIILTLPVAATISIGCLEQSRYRNIQGRLDKALYYSEIDRRNEPHGVSVEIEDPDGREPSRVPAPALVDIDSQIQVLVNKVPLSSGADTEPLDGPFAALTVRKAMIQNTLEALATTVEYRAEAMRLYGRSDPNITRAAITRFSTAEGKLITAFESLWEEGTREYEIMFTAYENLGSDPNLTPIYELLQSELDTIGVAERSLVDGLRDRVFVRHGIGDERLCVVHVKGAGCIQLEQKRDRHDHRADHSRAVRLSMGLRVHALPSSRRASGCPRGMTTV